MSKAEGSGNQGKRGNAGKGKAGNDKRSNGKGKGKRSHGKGRTRNGSGKGNDELVIVAGCRTPFTKAGTCIDFLNAFGLNGADITPHEHGDVASTDVFLPHEDDVGGLDHRIGRFNGPDETFGLHHAERICCHVFCRDEPSGPVARL